MQLYIFFSDLQIKKSPKGIGDFFMNYTSQDQTSKLHNVHGGGTKSAPAHSDKTHLEISDVSKEHADVKSELAEPFIESAGTNIPGSSTTG